MSDNSAKRHVISQANKGRDPQINSFGSSKKFLDFSVADKKILFLEHVVLKHKL